MATQADLRKDLDYLSEKVSDRTRVLDGGIVAVWWASMVGKETITGLQPVNFLAPAGFAAVSLLFDFLQYAIPYIGRRALLRSLERQRTQEFQYNMNAPDYKLRDFCFYLKQLFMAVGLIWLIVELVKVIV
jgi:hypothetical protein